MRRFIRSFTLFSAFGFILSLVVQILGVFNKAPFFGWFAFLLHFGILVALFAAVVAYFRLRRSEGRDFWKRALRASPIWMRWVLLLSLFYAVTNFWMFWNKLFNLRGKSSDEIMAIVLRGFSGHWLFFYFGLFLVFHAAMRATQQTALSET
ncbi:MAG TPA: hypothetical protein VE263_01645 [Candidatus Angelobacter sp.]|nr:hypothetical protein [Candidatus Angelobacter sp.]